MAKTTLFLFSLLLLVGESSSSGRSSRGTSGQADEVIAAMNGETASTAIVEKVKYQKSSVKDSQKFEESVS